MWAFTGLRVCGCWTRSRERWDGTAPGEIHPLPARLSVLAGGTAWENRREGSRGDEIFLPPPAPRLPLLLRLWLDSRLTRARGDGGPGLTGRPGLHRGVYSPAVEIQSLLFPPESRSRGKTDIVFLIWCLGIVRWLPGRREGARSVWARAEQGWRQGPRARTPTPGGPSQARKAVPRGRLVCTTGLGHLNAPSRRRRREPPLGPSGGRAAQTSAAGRGCQGLRSSDLHSCHTPELEGDFQEKRPGPSGARHEHMLSEHLPTAGARKKGPGESTGFSSNVAVGR